MIFKYVSAFSQPHVCLIIVPNWRSSLHCVENNIYVTHDQLFHLNGDSTSLCLGINIGYSALLVIGNSI